MIASGTYELGPTAGSLQVRTGRSGAAAKAGHDLLLEAGEWQATLVVDADHPERSTLVATVDPASLRVIEGTGGLKPLSDGDRRDIASAIARKVLSVDRHQEIRFTSSGASVGEDKTLTVDGELTIVGRTHPVQLRITRTDALLRTETSIEQTSFGIKPFSAMMGALKVADAVTVEVAATV